GIQPLQNTNTIKQLKARGVDDHEWLQYFISRGLDGLEASAAATAGGFLVGDAPTLADVCLVPQLYHARRFQLALGRWPLLRRVEAACYELDAFVAAHAERQPDAVPPQGK